MQKSLFGKYLRVTMVIVLASFIVLGSVMMFVFSQYTKSDKRKLLMQNCLIHGVHYFRRRHHE